ncbi:pyridoxamine 5'-phosphate oxidase family protein [Kitasatospora sp. NPDC051853]|uniref:pyridoxamine 5'-phosphate oxidase family protein n=1 Tax=Kitasatospora sp. NPDC051853 TaxID=3364058 RepID=UPI0037B4B181
MNSDTPLPGTVVERLAVERNAWLCTVRADGTPHVTPIWFVYRDGVWWIGSDARSVKVRNVLHRPSVSLALEGGNAPVVAEGEVTVRQEGDFPPGIVEAFAAKYAWDVSAPYRPDSARVLLEVPVRRWLLAGTAQ